VRRLWSRLVEGARRYLVAGILAFAPLAITIWAIAWIIERLDNLLLPRVLSLFLPAVQEPPRIPLLGALFTLLVIILLGIVARHMFGGQMHRAWERLLSRVPVARNIYGGVKQLFDAIFSTDHVSRFHRVVLIEYPRKGIYAIAFTTGPARGPIQAATESHMINCFLPTTPNPTSGFYLLVPEQEVITVDLSVEEGFKLIMSAGLVTPGDVPTGEISPVAEVDPVGPVATAK
jgi:uncharacterized membrane protein